MLAIGRENSDFLGLKELGVALNQLNGRIRTIGEQSQSHPNIYAVGDLLNGAACTIASHAAGALIRRLYSGSIELVSGIFF